MGELRSVHSQVREHSSEHNIPLRRSAERQNIFRMAAVAGGVLLLHGSSVRVRIYAHRQ